VEESVQGGGGEGFRKVGEEAEQVLREGEREGGRGANHD
jgi:hypothetical protein